jgi:hypothetical protein
VISLMQERWSGIEDAGEDRKWTEIRL